MAVLVGSSSTGDLDAVVRRIDQPNVKLVVYFISTDQKEHGVAEALSQRYPRAACIGASMIGGWSSDGPLERGITAMSLSEEEVETVFVSKTEGAKADPVRAGQQLVKDMRRKLGDNGLNPMEYVGILLVDGLCLGELVVKEIAMSRGFTVPVVGGAAADELEFKETLVCAGSETSSDGAVLAVMKMRVPFYYGHFVHYVPTATEFLVTAADPSKRVVWEIDGEPAAQHYAGLLGLSSVDDIAHAHFATHPLGVVIGDTVYARSPNAVIDGRGLQFYCFIEAGTRMRLLKQGDIVANARSARKEAEDCLGGVQGAILFNCVLRYLEMKEENTLAPFAEVFSGVPFVGFNTYGEELFTHHNQTLTALFLGRNS
jgi:hypothetical protein